MRPVRKRHSLQVSSMARRVLIVTGVALLSAGGLGVVLGVLWLVSHWVVGVAPYILETRLRMMDNVLPVLFVLAALIGAACAINALAKQARRDEGMGDPRLHRG